MISSMSQLAENLTRDSLGMNFGNAKNRALIIPGTLDHVQCRELSEPIHFLSQPSAKEK